MLDELLLSNLDELNDWACEALDDDCETLRHGDFVGAHFLVLLHTFIRALTPGREAAEGEGDACPDEDDGTGGG